jgi:hypothetical protein
VRKQAHLEHAGFALVESPDSFCDQARRVGQGEGDTCREVGESAVMVLADLGRVAVRAERNWGG